MKPLAYIPLSIAAASVAALASVQAYANPPKTIQFNLTVSAGAKACLPNENLEVVVEGLPPNTDFAVLD
jgi:hypothetical protein